MHALSISAPDGAVRRVVVRRPAESQWKSKTADATRTEFELHAALHAQGFLAPRPCLIDDSEELLPSAYFVMAFVEGSTTVRGTELPSALGQMADYLARLHALDVEGVGLPPLRALEDPLESLGAYLDDSPFLDRLRAGAPRLRPREAPPVSLLHGDFWPGNVLWHEGRMAAVIDWEDASLGDPLSDLACARVELLCRYDAAAMDRFMNRYVEQTAPDLTALPLWEVYVSAAALSSMAAWGLDPADEAERRRRTDGFFARAKAELLARLEDRC